MNPIQITQVIIEILILVALITNIGFMIYYEVVRRKLEVPVEDTGTPDMKYIMYHTEKLLNLIKEICNQVCVLKFNIFINSKDLSKITEAQIKSLIEECSRVINDNINLDNIDMDNLLITKEYYEFYIINLVINNINKLLNESLQNESLQ